MLESKTNIMKELIEQIKACSPCEAQFNPVLQAYERGELLTCYQTMLGNSQWLNSNNIIVENLEELAEGVGVTWSNDGAVWCRCDFKEGERHGVHEWFGVDGTLWLRENYVEGKKHGVSERFNEDGAVWSSCDYNEGVKC